MYKLFLFFVSVEDLKNLSHAERVLIYRFLHKELSFSEEGVKTIEPNINESDAVTLNGSHKIFFEEWETKLNSIDVNTFGVTLVLMGFCEFYPINMYPIFVANYYRVREIALIESILSQINNNSISLPKDLIISREYGLKSNRHRFTNKNLITMQDLNVIVKSMRLLKEPEMFIELLIPFHFLLINSIYLFLSITCESKIVLEASEIYATRLQYTLPVFVETTFYVGNWWFEIKSNKMFAFLNGQITMNAYISEITMRILKEKFKNMLVVGFIYKENILPLMIDSQPYIGDWDRTNQIISEAGFPILLQRGQPLTSRKIGFVKAGESTLFRLRF
jgi:hypothetical protein